ncbi:MAG: halocyanin domain-containing protein, partial [Halobacteriales archaeon]
MKRREFLTATGGGGVVYAATAATGAATPTTTPDGATSTPGNQTATDAPSTPEVGGTVKPDFGGWLDGVDGGYEDRRGTDEVTVQVGAEGNQGTNAFAPAGIWVSPGTTVKWEWTGDGSHNVVTEEGPADLDSGDAISDAGVNYEHTFEEAGITAYFCEPHKSLGMKGAVAVGPDVPTVETTPTAGGDGGEGAEGGGEGGLTLEEVEQLGVPFQAHWVGLATALMLL